MIIVHCDQGSSEWYEARAGAITASMFSEVRKRVNGLTEQQAKFVELVRGGMGTKEAANEAGYKKAPSGEKIDSAIAGHPIGEYTAAAKDYAFRLAIERISGEPLDEGHQTWAMRRGHEMEPDARSAHEFKADVTVERAGIVLTDDCKFGASADGLIGEDGGSEYKCLIAPDRLRSVIIEQDIEEFKDQVQGCLWLTGRLWWHFCLYCPALAPIGKDLVIHHVDRDDDYIAEMERDLLEFDKLVCEYQAQVESAKIRLKQEAA